MKQGAMFSYVSLEDRIPKSQPLHKLRLLVDAVLATMDKEFEDGLGPDRPAVGAAGTATQGDAVANPVHGPLRVHSLCRVKSAWIPPKGGKMVW